MELGLEKRTAVVLGSTSGIGAAVSRALVAEGANVVTVGRDAERTRVHAAALGSALPVVADLTEPGAAEKIVRLTERVYGSVDIVVLNGGGPPPGTAAAMTGGDVDSAIRLLLGTHLDLVRLVLPGMVERRWGRLIAVGSSGVQQPLPNLALSNVGRAALSGYLKTLAAEVARDGVTVNMVLPGRIETARVHHIDQANAERSGRTVEDVRAASIATIPAGRYGRPEEFAAVVAFLAGEPASYITGEEIRCDGGLVRGR
ncbi:SDR family oxidoreductase [Ornithinimicrobium cavernae]|uniref:SDR family oxidoreductase n=1 Tax=Ornithinimicrobium cavernae TaxID=2666047 RepID=UPI000D69AE54|nr:SDR family oxidoreductase [Ornithinimicrobium cavernae]